ASQEIIKLASWTNQARTKAFRPLSRHPPPVPQAKEQTMPAATQSVMKPASHGVSPATADLVALKSRQQASWSSGDYAIVGRTLQIVGEELCEALDLRAGQRVLDVAAGNGNATLAAARRWCQVTSTDYVPSLLECGRTRASAEGLKVAFKVADAEALPFDDGA